MREELRKLLKDNATSEKIESFVNKILQKLEAENAKLILLNDPSIVTTNTAIII